MRKLVLGLACGLSIMGSAYAQENTDLVAENIAIVEMVDAFGQTVYLAEGQLTNEGSAAYTDLALFAEVYDEAGTLVGEGFGFAVNACGVALVDLALQPGTSQPFTVTLELYEAGSVPASAEIIVEANAVEVNGAAAELSDALTPIDTQEVVALEWVDAVTLRYGVGCANSVFTALNWYSYDLTTETSAAITHPNAEQITEALLTQTGLNEGDYYEHSFLTFSPTSRRIVYQTEINTFITAEPDGSFKRILYDDLFRRSLQGIIWLPEGRFLAYYFGAYGEPVLYFTGSADGQRISNSIYFSVPSLIVPGSMPSGTDAVIAVEVEGVVGYYLRDTIIESQQLLFEGEAPGNNYPAPVYVQRESGVFVYLVRRIEGENLLQCFDMQTRELHDLTVLPLNLPPEARGWSWLSPDNTMIAYGQNGVDSGLWLVDLTAFEVCF